MRRWRAVLARHRGIAVAAQLVIVAQVARVITVPLWRAHRAAGWTETRCTIDAIDDDDAFTYHHVVDGQTRHATRTDFSVDHGRWYRFMDVEVGSEVPCWYDPGTPSEATLVRFGWAHDDGSVLLFSLGAAVMGLLGWLSRRDDGGARGWVALTPRALLAAVLAIATYAAPDGSRTGADVFGLAVVAMAAVAWLGLGADRWARARRRLPAARVMGSAGRPRSASARS